MLRRKEPSHEIAEIDGSQPSLEAELESAFDFDAGVDDYAPDQDKAVEAEAPDYPATDPTADIESDAFADAPTAHAQALLAAFSVFEEATNSTRDELTKIGKAFTSIVTNFNLGRDFLDGCRQEILRASELEQANQRLSAQSRRLTDRADKLESLRERLNDQLDAARRREARLVQEADTLRMTVSDLRLETVELRNANANAEHGRSEMHQALAAKTADAERLSRENDVLREKIATMTAELDLSHRRQAEMRLQMEEAQALHTTETSQLAETSGRLAAAEKEVLRLQKHCDVTEAQIREVSLALQRSEHEVWESSRRYQAEAQALKNEISQLQQRLARATSPFRAFTATETRDSGAEQSSFSSLRQSAPEHAPTGAGARGLDRSS